MNVLEAIESISAPDAQRGDYITDGLLYCGLCNTRRQTRVEIMGREVKVPCACAHEEHLWAAREKGAKAGRHTKAVKRTFADDDGANPAMTRVREFAEQFDPKAGEGLVLFGGPGTGKTFACECLVNALLSRGVSATIVNVPELVQRARAGAEWLDEATWASLLVLDDVGADRGTGYSREIVYTAVNARYSRGKPTVASTNASIDQIVMSGDVGEQRLFGRLVERADLVDFGCKDRRLGFARKDEE